MDTTRRDVRGRRIGRNWWRETICDMLSDAEAAWQRRRESGESIQGHSVHIAGAEYDTGYYQLTDDEYKQVFPRPTLREFLETYAGHWTREEAR